MPHHQRNDRLVGVGIADHVPVHDHTEREPDECGGAEQSSHADGRSRYQDGRGASAVTA